MDNCFRKIIATIIVSSMLFLSGCTRFSEQCDYENNYKGSITLSDIKKFYDSNSVLLNAAIDEYILNTTNEDYVSIFYSQSTKLKIWDPLNKVDYSEQKEKYGYCEKVIYLMKDYMLEHGFEEINVDYSVGITPYTPTFDNNTNANMPFCVMFEFTALDTNVESHFYVSSFSIATIDNTVYYRLFYSTVQLSDYQEIAENWYVEEWHHI